MWPIISTVLAHYHRERDTSRDAVSTLLASGCRVLTSTPPALINAASISCAVSSPEEGDLLAARVRRLAAGAPPPRPPPPGRPRPRRPAAWGAGGRPRPSPPAGGPAPAASRR